MTVPSEPGPASPQPSPSGTPPESPAPASGRDRRLPRSRDGQGRRADPRLLLALLAGTALALIAAGQLADLAVRRLYGHWRPLLERQIGGVMGRPLRLGPYRGLGLDGLQVGASRFLPGSLDRSSASVSGLTVLLDPFASWQRGELVLDVSLAGARADLRPDPLGRLWVLGQQRPGQTPPRLDLRLRLLDAGDLTIWPRPAGTAPLRLRVQGQVRVQPPRRRLEGLARVRQPGGEGSLLLEGHGQWQRRFWQVELRPESVGLAGLRPWLPASLGSPIHGFAGRASGRVLLRFERGTSSCAGQLRIGGLRWQAGRQATPLIADALTLGCRQRQLTVQAPLWRFGGWRGALAGDLDLNRRLAVNLQLRPPAAAGLGPVPATLRLTGRLQGGGLLLRRLRLQRGGSWLEGQGRLASRLDLAGRWAVAPDDLARIPRLPAALSRPGLQGGLRFSGSLADPLLAVSTGSESSATPLGPWQASLLWHRGLLQLASFRSRQLLAEGSLPLRRGARGGLEVGALEARLRLRPLALERLQPWIRQRLGGVVQAQGSLRGPLRALRLDLALRLERPALGMLSLQEIWTGRLQAASGQGARLALQASEPALSGSLLARFDRRWTPVALDLRRAGGSLQLRGTPRRSTWQARALPLEGLALAAGGAPRPHPLAGLLDGSGQLGFSPFQLDGRLHVVEPRFLAVVARSLDATIRTADRRYQLKASLETLASGQVALEARGRWRGPLQASLEARQLSDLSLRQLRRAVALWRGGSPRPHGRASDLGSLAIHTLERSLDDQLLQLQASLSELATRLRPEAQASAAARLAALRSRFDAEAQLRGPSLAEARLDLEARGHLWLDRRDRDLALLADPLRFRLQGPLGSGGGTFSFDGLPLSLLALVTPVPGSLRGSLGATGRYRLGGRRPELELDLSLADAALASRDLRFERGRLALVERGVDLDLSLLAAGASSSVDLSGTVPLDPRRRALELRLSSRGDGLRFVSELASAALTWRGGSADLQLLVRGSLADPIANGFVRIRDGSLRFIGQDVKALQATVLFDFGQVQVQELQARVGRGRIDGSGTLGLLRPLPSSPSLAVNLHQVPFSHPRIQAVADGQLLLGGSLRAPSMGGTVAIAHGTINARPGELGRPQGGQTPGSGQEVKPQSLNQLLESKWDFQQPLVLLGPEVDSPIGESLRQSVPRVPWLAFDSLRLSFAPDMGVVLAQTARFRTGGTITVNGRLDASLQLAGVMRLLGGRVNLFTTSFSLDPGAPNVAIFTPSTGLVPYLDIALRTRIADSLDVIAPSGVPGLGVPSVQQVVDPSGFTSLEQLKLILVTVSVSGPADRIAENLRLTSSPPLPQERLVALIGGNSLAGLRDGAAGTALATVLGQSLLSPLLGSLSDALGQRVSLAIYPSYVNQNVPNRRAVLSRRLPPQLVLGSEIGFDLTDRLKLSLLAAPNRSDIPSVLTLNIKASELVGIEASLDGQGAWSSQFQVFFRF